MRIFMGSMYKKAREQQVKQQQPNQTNSTFSSNKKKKVGYEGGEYVDFEEVD